MRVLGDIDKRTKDAILALYNEIKRNRSLDELILFKTLVWSCLAIQENNHGGWLTPRQTFYTKGPCRLSELKQIDEVFRQFKSDPGGVIWFGMKIKDNFGHMI